MSSISGSSITQTVDFTDTATKSNSLITRDSLFDNAVGGTIKILFRALWIFEREIRLGIHTYLDF